MKTSMLKMTRLLVASITGGTRSVASAIGRFAFVATALCATAVPLSSQAETPDYFVDWVQPSAALYVDTGITGKDGTKIELRAMCDADSFSSTRWPIILGSNKSNSNGRFNLAMLENWSGLKTRWEHGGSMPDHMDAAYYCDFKFEVEASSSGTMTGKWTRWDGTSQTATGSYGTLNTGLSMYLFATHYNDGSSGDQAYQNFLGRLYYCKIWQVPDGSSDYALVRDFHPCVKDGVAGLYDSVSRTIFYPPASGNALKAGPATFDPATCPSDSRVGSVDHTSTLFGRIAYSGDRSGMSDASWRLIGLNDYTLKGMGDTANLNGANTTWQNNNLRHAQLRFDGWFQVDSSKAGTWTINQKFDDYFAFFIDTNLVLYNNSYTGEANATVDVAEGWHRFTIIAGDTYGGYGSSKNYGGGIGTVPFTITVNGTAYAFNTSNFPQGSGTNVVTLNANTDWQSLGPLLLNSGTVLDLNGHQLAVKDIYSDDFLGVCITNSAAGKAVLVFTGTPTDSIAYKSGLVREAGTKILFAKYGESSASWTGNGNDGGNALNPNNWQDTLTEEPVLPTAAHAVSIVGSNVNLQIPSGSTFTCKSFEIGNCTFTVECDWSGLPVKPTITGTANLNGHNLHLPHLAAAAGSSFANSAAGTTNEVRFTVADTTYSSSFGESLFIDDAANLSLAGNVRIALVKEGDGTFSSSGFSLGNQAYEVDFVQTNGTAAHTSAQIGISGHHGVYRMSGGSVTATGSFEVGPNGVGEFLQTGGNVTLQNWFNLGRYDGGNGTYTITGGSLLVNKASNGSADKVYIAAGNSRGTLNVGGDGDVEFRCALSVGAKLASHGGKGYVKVYGNGSLHTTGDTFLGQTNGETGEATMDGGTFNVDSVLRVGHSGSGVFTLNGGALSAGSWAGLGVNGDGTGTFRQNGGTFTMANNTLNVGNDGKGWYYQNGGTNKQLRVAIGANNQSNANGTYDIRGGLLDVSSYIYVGGNKVGQLVIGGDGVVIANGGVTIANGSTGSGTLTLSGGVLETTFLRKGAGTAATLLLNSGTIVATNVTDGANFISGLDNLVFGNPGGTIDTADANVSVTGCGLYANPGSALTKTGTGTLTLSTIPPADHVTVEQGTLALAAGGDNTPSASLAHRWSFAGDLTDSVTGTAGTMSGSGATYEDGVVKLPGGNKGTCYIDLGANKLPSDSVTIEAWFTLRSQVDWTRVFVIGGSSGHYTVFNSRRSGDGNACNFDSLNGTQIVTTSGKVLSKDVQYYVAVTYTPDGNGGVIEKQYVKKVGDSGFIWNNTVTKANWSVTANAAQGYFWLGHSTGNDKDTNIDFDEVRVWSGALDDTAIALSVEKGADATAADIAEIVAANAVPAQRTLELASGTSLSIASGTLTQPVVNANGTLASGNLVVTEQINVTPGQSMTVASGATLDLTGADIVVTGEIPAGGCVIATAPSGGIVAAKPRKLTGGYWLYLKSGEARIGKRKGVMVIAH